MSVVLGVFVALCGAGEASDDYNPASTGLGIALIILGLCFTIRSFQVGIRVEPKGVTVISLWMTRSVAWSRVKTFTEKHTWYDKGGAFLAVQLEDGRLLTTYGLTTGFSGSDFSTRTIIALEHARGEAQTH